MGEKNMSEKSVDSKSEKDLNKRTFRHSHIFDKNVMAEKMYSCLLDDNRKYVVNNGMVLWLDRMYDIVQWGKKKFYQENSKIGNNDDTLDKEYLDISDMQYIELVDTKLLALYHFILDCHIWMFNNGRDAIKMEEISKFKPLDREMVLYSIINRYLIPYNS